MFVCVYIPSSDLHPPTVTVEEYSRSGPPALCDNGVLVDVLTHLTQWASHFDCAPPPPPPTPRALPHTHSFAAKRPQTGAGEGGAFTASFGSESPRPWTSKRMVTPIRSGTPGGAAANGVPKPLREVVTGSALFDGHDPAVGLNHVQVRPRVCVCVGIVCCVLLLHLV